MFECILLTPAGLPYDFENKDFYPFILYTGHEYYLKIDLPSFEGEFKECLVRVFNWEYDEEIILIHKFYNKACIKFKCDSNRPSKGGNFILASIECKIPDFTGSMNYFDFEIYAIRNAIIEKLKTNLKIKQLIYDLLDRYFNDDFDAAITKIGIIGEHIAMELVKKTELAPSNFRDAINKLTNYPLIKQKKINYSYIGSLLWPIYYIRNEKSHPNPNIEFNKSVAEMTIKNLSTIIDYLAEAKIRF